MRLIIMVGILLIGFMACRQKQQEVKPELKQLTEAVYASGTLVPEQEYKVVASTEGYLAHALVKEGDSVVKGQTLFELSNTNQQAQVQSAAAILKKTMPATSDQSPAIRELNNRLSAARIRLQNDSIQFERYDNLYRQNAISASNFEKYKLQYETSQKDVSALEQQIYQQKLTLALQLQQADNQLKLAKTSSSNGILKSFVTGTVYDVYKQTGDMVYLNQPVALIGAGKMIAKLMVDEDDLGKVHTGQQVLITMDAYPGRIFKARINKIYPLLNKVEQSFRVDAFFEDELPVKLYGLNVEANIVIQEKDSVLVIPRKAVFEGDSVLLREGNKLTKVRITRGVEDEDWVQVSSGLTIHSTLILRP
jgi:HlyD family secretion protein